MPEELLPKPQVDLPKPEMEIPAHAGKPNLAIFKSKFFLGFLVFSFLIAFLIGGFYIGKNQTKTSPAIITPSPTPDPTAGWQTLQDLDYSIKFPPNWKKIDHNIIAEKSFVPGEQDPTQIYNVVEIQKYDTPIYTGYTNQEWYEKIKNVQFGDSFTDQKNTYKRIDTAPGSVSLFISPSSSASSSSTYQIKTYFLSGQSMYIITLDLYNMDGTEALNKILPTFNFGASKISCRPRPGCLDSEPKCMIPETSDMCPPSISPTPVNVCDLEPCLTTPTPTKATQIFCAQDARQCPDGSWVGRSGPKCEFICPSN